MFSESNAHHLRMYPTIEMAVDTKKAFRLPQAFDIHVTTGMIKKAVNTALIVENHAGHCPAFS
jgi:hypothetical protein